MQDTRVLFLGWEDPLEKHMATQRMRWFDSITDPMDINLRKPRRWWRTEEPGMLQSMGL